MDSEIVRSDGGDATPDSSREVEFALMLSRVIDSVSKNPDYLRATIYELARHKLKEEFQSESAADVRQLSKSLEVAIQGVEAFNKKKIGVEAALLGLDITQENSLISTLASRQEVTPVVQQAPPLIEARVFGAGGAPAWKRIPRFGAVRWFAAALGIGLSVIVTVVSLELLRNRGFLAVNQAAPIVPKAEPAAPPQAAPAAVEPKAAAPSPLVPTSFGIFAISDGKLHELDVLPGRAPDPRIAISSLITTPSRATLPDGHVSFVIYRRDSATNAADRAEVRLIARIEKEASFGKDGKQIITAINDNWVMRNISVPYRTGPKKDYPDMYEIRSEDPNVPLSPGRYALVIKGLAYDFTIAGQATDPRLCLERLLANNGQFYSECRKP
jgi:hypothetical protein